MAAKNVLRTGDSGSGTCFSHGTPLAVTGTLVTGEDGAFANDGSKLCTNGDTVQLSCGHTGVLVATGLIDVDGINLGLHGDAWTDGTGVTEGTITVTKSGITEG